MTATSKHQVVIVGGGFGGLTTAQQLRWVDCEVTLVDRRNFHLFQPLLYQVATGGLSPSNIATPLRAILKHQQNARVVLGEVVDIDPANRRLILADDELPYDTLVLATGSTQHYFGNDQWKAKAPGLKTIEDALEIRRRVFLSFETAERLESPESRTPYMTFVVVGAGPTGVELAGAMAELARYTLKKEFRRIDTSEARILLVEGEPRVLNGYDETMADRAQKSLEQLGVELRLGCHVVEVADDHVALKCGEETETIATHSVLWGAGVKASPLGQKLAQAIGCETDRGGRLIVQPDCSVKGSPEIFAIGDLAHFDSGGEPLPGVAQTAIQMGKYVARVIRHRLQQRDPPAAFQYKDLGKMATIGRAAAVAEIGSWKFGGYFAWLLWLFVHLITLVGHENRFLVLTQWAWNYFTRNRSSRLITDADADADLLDEQKPG